MIHLEFNASAVFAALDRARRKLDDMQPLYERIGDRVADDTKDRFLSGTAPDGTRWRQKAPATLADYIRRGDGPRPRPLIGVTGNLGKNISFRASRDGVEIGSNKEYSGVMQFGARRGAFGATRSGSPIPWGDIPARPWLGLSDQDERNIIDITDEWIEAALE